MFSFMIRPRAQTFAEEEDLWDLLSLFACFISAGMFLHIPLDRGLLRSYNKHQLSPPSGESRRGPWASVGEMPMDTDRTVASFMPT